MTTETVTITAADDGQRLDRWFKKHYPDASFAQVQKILRTGQVRVDGKRVKGEARLAEGQVVRIPPQIAAPPKDTKSGLTEKDATFIRSLVIYSDKYIIALNKPQGLAVQGGSKINKHIDGMLDGLKNKAEDERPHLVHRIDKDTSGLLLIARDTKTARALSDAFRARDIRKYYWAVTSPVPEKQSGKIKSMLAKVGAPGEERMQSVSTEDGKLAVTFFNVIERVSNQLALVAFWPRTGRTHQIRVHAAEMGTPLIGDFKYDRDQLFLSENPGMSDALHLHARRIIMPHPMTGEPLDITAPLGAEMKKTFKYFGFNPDDKSDPFEDVE